MTRVCFHVTLKSRRAASIKIHRPSKRFSNTTPSWVYSLKALRAYVTKSHPSCQSFQPLQMCMSIFFLSHLFLSQLLQISSLSTEKHPVGLTRSSVKIYYGKPGWDKILSLCPLTSEVCISLKLSNNREQNQTKKSPSLTTMVGPYCASSAVQISTQTTTKSANETNNWEKSWFWNC